MKSLHRRTLLKAAGATLALPWLDAFAQPTTFPRRLIIVFTANGTIADQWLPTGTTSTFTLNRLLKPLEPFQRKLLVLDGIDCESANHGPGNNAHDLSMGHLLTGIELVPGPQGAGSFGHLVDGSAGGPSVDQFIASRLNAGTRFQSLEFGVRAQNIFQPLPSRLVYKGRFQPVQPENNPGRMFDRLFGGGAPQPERGDARRKLTLEHVQREFAALMRTVGTEDQKRLDAHATSLVELERRLESRAPMSCVAPGRPAAANDYPTEGRLMMDLIHAALVCDLTRVVTLQWSTAQSSTTFPWLGFSENHHELSHAGDSAANEKEKLLKINEWYAQQFAYLLQKLDSTPEGPGTLLDHTCVVWVNELSKGNNHSHNNVPIVMAGSLGGYFSTGRFIRFPGTVPHNNLLLSLIRGMGVTADSFGNPVWCNTPLTLLTTP